MEKHSIKKCFESISMALFAVEEIVSALLEFVAETKNDKLYSKMLYASLALKKAKEDLDRQAKVFEA